MGRLTVYWAALLNGSEQIGLYLHSNIIYTLFHIRYSEESTT